LRVGMEVKGSPLAIDDDSTDLPFLQSIVYFSNCILVKNIKEYQKY